MIFRVEFNKDGTIGSCRNVEKSLKNGNFVIYIDAVSPEVACKKAKNRYNEWQKRRRAQAEARGMCRDCYRRAVVPESPRCESCLAKAERAKAARLEIEALPPEEREAALAARREEWRLRRAIVSKAAGERAGETNRQRSDDFWDAAIAPRAPNVQAALRQCLRAFDRNPSAFREWLVARLLTKAAEEAA
jgi:hypothetical protein